MTCTAVCVVHLSSEALYELTACPMVSPLVGHQAQGMNKSIHWVRRYWLLHRQMSCGGELSMPGKSLTPSLHRCHATKGSRSL